MKPIAASQVTYLPDPWQGYARASLKIPVVASDGRVIDQARYVELCLLRDLAEAHYALAEAGRIHRRQNFREGGHLLWRSAESLIVSLRVAGSPFGPSEAEPEMEALMDTLREWAAAEPDIERLRRLSPEPGPEVAL